MIYSLTINDPTLRGKNMRLPLWATIFCFAFIPSATWGCTAFFLSGEKGMTVGKNLDWSIDDGYIHFNKSGTDKTSFTKGSEYISWTSKFNSITFNQFGKEFPLGGMNDQGLVIEELNAPQLPNWNFNSVYVLNEFQIVQYLLDNCRSVEEIKDVLDNIRVVPDIIQLHYFAADKKGNVTIIELFAEGFSFYPVLDSYEAVLSNNSYNESLQYLKRYEKHGGELHVKNRPGSNERFAYVAEKLRIYDNEPPVDYAFDILEDVSQNDTRWTVVYDLTAGKIIFKHHRCDERATIDFTSMLNDDLEDGIGCPLGKCDTEVEFRKISAEENEKLIMQVFNQISRTMDVDKNLFRQFADYGNQFLAPSVNKILSVDIERYL